MDIDVAVETRGAIGDAGAGRTLLRRELRAI